MDFIELARSRYSCKSFDSRQISKEQLDSILEAGRSGSYEKVLIEAKETSMQEMMQRAQALGANAIVGIDIDYETIGANGSMLMVATSGTAVVI